MSQPTSPNRQQCLDLFLFWSCDYWRGGGWSTGSNSSFICSGITETCIKEINPSWPGSPGQQTGTIGIWEVWWHSGWWWLPDTWLDILLTSFLFYWYFFYFSGSWSTGRFPTRWSNTRQNLCGHRNEKVSDEGRSWSRIFLQLLHNTGDLFQENDQDWRAVWPCLHDIFLLHRPERLQDLQSTLWWMVNPWYV